MTANLGYSELHSLPPCTDLLLPQDMLRTSIQPVKKKDGVVLWPLTVRSIYTCLDFQCHVLCEYKVQSDRFLHFSRMFLPFCTNH